MLLFFRIFGINVKITYGIGTRFALKNQISLSKFFNLKNVNALCLVLVPIFHAPPPPQSRGNRPPTDSCLLFAISLAFNT
jgi:hypothetical protein